MSNAFVTAERHKQELYKGRKSDFGFVGTTKWSGWGFNVTELAELV